MRSVDDTELQVELDLSPKLVWKLEDTAGFACVPTITEDCNATHCNCTTEVVSKLKILVCQIKVVRMTMMRESTLLQTSARKTTRTRGKGDFFSATFRSGVNTNFGMPVMSPALHTLPRLATDLVPAPSLYLHHPRGALPKRATLSLCHVAIMSSFPISGRPLFGVKDATCFASNCSNAANLRCGRCKILPYCVSSMTLWKFYLLKICRVCAVKLAVGKRSTVSGALPQNRLDTNGTRTTGPLCRL